jgi:hypothetical protein
VPVLVPCGSKPEQLGLLITIIRYNEGPLRKGFHAGITRRNHPFRLLFNYRRDARRRFRLLFFLSQFEIVP